MMLFPVEPIVRIGLCENESFGLKPVGDFQISASENQIVYTPLSSDSRMEVSGMTIGRRFHWESRHTFSYHGVMMLSRDEAGHKRLINLIKAEEYLKSVISSEMSPEAPAEYLKAHAIISRSWLMRMLTRKADLTSISINSPGRIISYTQGDAHTHFDVCADDHCQRYQGIDTINERAAEAVHATRALVLADASGNVADTRFSKCCGGRTELFSTAWDDKDFDYLPSREDPYCNPDALTPQEKEGLYKCLKGYDASTPFYHWHSHVDATLISRNLLSQHGIDLGDITALHPVEQGPSGRLREIEVTGTLGSCSIGKELAIRRLLSETHLLSSAFSVTPVPGGFLLHGRGWGHGVGLCQTGAAVMALRGFSCEEILNFYFPGTHIISCYD